MGGSCHGAHRLAQAGCTALQLGDGIGLASTVASPSLGPGGDRTGDAGGLTGVGLSLQAGELSLAPAAQLLTAAHPGHVTGLGGGMGRENGGHEKVREKSSDLIL